MAENRLHIGSLGPGDIALLKNIATEAAEQTMRRWSVQMGIDPDQPMASQRAFSVLRTIVTDPETTLDASWTRRTRVRTEGMMGKAILTAVGLGVVSGVHALWTGLAAALNSAKLPLH